MVTKFDTYQSIKLAIILFLITNRNLFGDIGFLTFYIICVWYILRDGLYWPVFKYVAIIMFPILVGFVMGLPKHEMYDTFKDIYYFLSPVFTCYVGCIIAKRTSINVLKQAFLIVGIFMAIFYVFSVFIEVGMLALGDPRAARYERDSSVSCAVFLSLGILLWDVTSNSQTVKKQGVIYIILFLINLLAIYISGSRTYWITVLVFMGIVAWSYIKERLMRFIVIGIVTLISIVMLLSANPNNTTVEVLLHSVEEMTEDDFSSSKKRNDNYRAYEAYRAMNQFENYHIKNRILGGGFGEKIDMVISPIGIRYIPILHNAYPYILIKVGYLGMACFILFGLILVRGMWILRNVDDSDLKMFCYMAIGGVLATFIINASVWGLFNNAYNILLMLSGIFIYYYNKEKFC